MDWRERGARARTKLHASGGAPALPQPPHSPPTHSSSSHTHSDEEPALPDAIPGACGGPLSLTLDWTAEAGASLYATPLITDLFSDGAPEVVAPGFVGDLEAFDAASGARWADGRWPAPHASTVHASPLAYDLDGDGVPELLVAAFDGSVLAYRDTGARAWGGPRLVVPRLAVRRGWHEGLDAEAVGHDRLDVGGGGGKAAPAPPPPSAADAAAAAAALAAQRAAAAARAAEDARAAAARAAAAGNEPHQQGRRRLAQAAAVGGGDEAAASAAVPGDPDALAAAADAAAAAASLAGPDAADDRAVARDAAEGFRDLFAPEDGGGGGGAGGAGGAADPDPAAAASTAQGLAAAMLAAGGGGDLPPEAYADLVAQGYDAGEVAAFRDQIVAAAAGEVNFEGETEAAETGGGGGGGGGGEEREDAPASWGADPASIPGAADPSVDAAPRDASHAAGSPPLPPASPTIHIDPHLLSTPVVADVDGDGADELVLAVSYFFEGSAWPADRVERELGPGVRLGDYLASGVVALSLRTGGVVWAAHLDLSTEATEFTARALASPTVADVDGDGSLEVVVGTSMGFVYVLAGKDGKAREGWPLQMGPVSAPVGVADVDGDGRLEVIAGDSRGNVAAFTPDAKVLWERHLGSALAPGGVRVGDVDGCGLRVEVVFGTASGRVYVLAGADGADLPGFPFATGGRIGAGPLLVPLGSDGGGGRGGGGGGSGLAARLLGGKAPPSPPSPPPRPPLHIVIPSFDGRLYAIDGRTGKGEGMEEGGGERRERMGRPASSHPHHPLSRLFFCLSPCPLTGCADWLDIGEAAYATPLADDLDGDGLLEVVVATMSGGLYSVATGARVADPAAATREAVPGGNCFVARPGYQGITADAASRAPRDVRGRDFTVRFAVVDSRPNGTRSDGGTGPGRGPYRVSVTLSGVGHAAMGQGPAPVVGMADTVTTPGTYALTLPAPRTRSTAVVVLEMVDEVRRMERAPRLSLSRSL